MEKILKSKEMFASSISHSKKKSQTSAKGMQSSIKGGYESSSFISTTGIQNVPGVLGANDM